MKNVPIKVQITIWYLLLMTIMAGLLLSFLLLISGSVSSQTAMDQLSQTVRSNLRQVDLVDGALHRGISTTSWTSGSPWSGRRGCGFGASWRRPSIPGP